jgi:excisionase family DNA binding protein
VRLTVEDVPGLWVPGRLAQVLGQVLSAELRRRGRDDGLSSPVLSALLDQLHAVAELAAARVPSGSADGTAEPADEVEGARWPREDVDVDSAAVFLGYSAEYVRRLARTGALPAVKVGRAWRIDREDLVEFERERRRGAA